MESDGLGGLCLEKLDWDSEQLGLSAGLVANEALIARYPAPDVFDRIRAILAQKPEISFITFKIPDSCTDIVNMLVRGPADFIDTELIYRFSGPVGKSSACQVIFTEQWQGEEFVPLASEMRWSRFFLDKRIAAAKADGLWRTSIANHCQGRADQLAVALLDGQPAGLVVITAAGGEKALFLVGVLPEYQGRGIGTALLKAVTDRYGATAPLYVETSSRNLAANRLYQKAGFVLHRTRYILHCIR